MADGIQPQEGAAGTGGRPTIAFMAGVTLSDLTITVRGFVVAMRKVEEGATAATTRAQVKEMIAETFPPESLFDPELNTIPTLYRDLRAWLQAHGVVIGVRPKRRILHHLAEYLYDNEEDKQMAHDMARMVLDKQRRMRQADPVPVGEAKLNPEITQIQTRNELALLRFNAFVKQGMSEMNALKELHKVITKNAPLLPLEYRTDRLKRDFIRHALVGVPWAEPVINRCTSVGAQFQELYAELAGALQLNLEGRITNSREDGLGDQKPVAIPVQLTADGKHVVIPTHYANQGMYALPNKGMSPPAVDEGMGAKEETFDDVEELYYETLLTANGGTDAEGDTESGFEEGPSFRPGA
ncbi:hypothetical protein I4F81_004918 [Pyropia yezoensis]|uniref:Uncharacterized protein n=1 Tax=Pyropia yezoensis TaxID=2788 RepID=A0ACC3BXB5_PYRYE|nr:hypothetical protein I4F81_004918 [Neopyropia yezoensis]